MLASVLLPPRPRSISGAEASGIRSSSGACCPASASDGSLGGVLCGVGGRFGCGGLRAGLSARAEAGGARGSGVAEDEPGLGISKGALQENGRSELDPKKIERNMKYQLRCNSYPAKVGLWRGGPVLQTLRLLAGGSLCPRPAPRLVREPTGREPPTVPRSALGTSVSAGCVGTGNENLSGRASITSKTSTSLSSASDDKFWTEGRTDVLPRFGATFGARI